MPEAQGKGYGPEFGRAALDFAFGVAGLARVVAITRELNVPIRYIGVGEQIDDLLPFDPEQFVSSLFD